MRGAAHGVACRSLPSFLPDFGQHLAGDRGDHLVERRSMPGPDQQGNSFDLTEVSCSSRTASRARRVRTILMNRHVDVFAKAPPKRPGVNVELSRARRTMDSGSAQFAAIHRRPAHESGS